MAIPAAFSNWVFWCHSWTRKSIHSLEESGIISRFGISPYPQLHQPLLVEPFCVVSHRCLLHLHAEIHLLL